MHKDILVNAVYTKWRSAPVCRKGAGFTLIELLVTFAVIGLLIAVSTTFLRLAGPTLTLRSFSRDLASDIRYASELALSTQLPHAVRFETDLRRYTVVRQTIPEVVIKAVLLEPTLSFSSITIPSGTVIFNSLGATSTPGTVTIRHTNNATTILDVRPSGYVRIE